MDNYICKIASMEEMHQKWDYEIKMHMGDEAWPIWKENAIVHAGTGQSVAYYGILNGRVIVEASAALDPSIVQNGEGLADERTAYLSAFRTIEEYRGQGYFSKLFQFMLNDLKAKGYERVTLGVEPCEIENMQIYFHYGFREYVKMGQEIYPGGEKIDVIYYARQLYGAGEGDISLRLLQNDQKDMELLLKWLTNPLVIQHVYEEGAPWSLEKVQEEFAEKVAEEGSATACIILYKDREIGYLQYYPIEEDSYKFNDLDTYEKIKDGYGIDMFIGEPELWQKGIGRRALGILEEYLRDKLHVHTICVDPATDNDCGMGFWPRVGFEPIDTVENYDDSSKQSVLMVKSL